MTKTTKAIVVSALLIASFVLAVVFLAPKKQFNTVVYKYGSGWGYGIYHGRHLVIMQPIIPCFSSNKSFSTKEQAKEVGDLVAAKLQNNEDPSLQKEEVIALLK
jgi:uncharacterized membrane protein YagU involved in acid resistance